MPDEGPEARVSVLPVRSLADDCADSERSSEMERKITIAASVCVLLLAAVLTVTVRLDAGAVQPVFGEEAEDLLAAVQLGCEETKSRVSSSAGTVTVHEWHWRSSGELLETETQYTVASAGDKFRAVCETRYITNEWVSRESGLPFNPPGTVQRVDMAYDGEKVTRYEPQRGRADIAGPNSNWARELGSIRRSILSPGGGVPVVRSVARSERRDPIDPRVVGREMVNGDECIVCELAYRTPLRDGCTGTFYDHIWVNPAKGFTFAKEESGARGGLFGDGMLLAEAEIDVRKCGDDLWGLSEVRHDQYGLDDAGERYLNIREIITFGNDYRLNPTVTDDMLTVTLPSGTKVYNELIDAHYAVP